jgi:hypothetical protein
MSIVGYVNCPTLDTPSSVKVNERGSTEWLSGRDAPQ